MYYEIITILFLFFLYWYFNLRQDKFISIPVPMEKMDNVSIFDSKY